MGKLNTTKPQHKEIHITPNGAIRWIYKVEDVASKFNCRIARVEVLACDRDIYTVIIIDETDHWLEEPFKVKQNQLFLSEKEAMEAFKNKAYDALLYCEAMLQHPDHVPGLGASFVDGFSHLYELAR